MLVLSVVAPGMLAPAWGQAGDANAVQETETDLRLTATGSSVIVPGHNVTVDFTLTNVGDASSTAPVVELVSVPSDWTVVDQSGEANVSWSEVNSAWVSSETLEAGESANVSVTFQLPNETARSVYHVSARAFDAAGNSATAVEEFPVGASTDGPLDLEGATAESVRPGENVTVNFSLRNAGTDDSTAPVVDLTSVPTGWTVVNQSAGANVSWSEVNSAWISTGTLAPGESLNVSVVLQTSRESPVGQYFVSAGGFDEGNGTAVSTVSLNVSGEPIPRATQTANATTTAVQETTETEEETTETEDETTETDEETTEQ